jgi:hypothetical protein
MIGGGVGAVIVLLAISLLAWVLMRRRRRNQEIRAFLIASPDPFPHYENNTPSQAASSPSGPRRMTIQTYPSTSMPRPTFSSAEDPDMTETAIYRAPITTTRKKPIPFLDNPDLGLDNRLSMQSASTSSTLTPPLNPVHVHPVAAENPFADPVRNPFEDPNPGVPAVMVLPATPLSDKRHSAVSTSTSDSREVCCFFQLMPRSAERLKLLFPSTVSHCERRMGVGSYRFNMFYWNWR